MRKKPHWPAAFLVAAALVVALLGLAAVRLNEQERAVERDRLRERLDNAAARRAGIRGTGIGLAIVEEIVTFHGGNLAIQSEVGAGSAFTLSLPTEPNPCNES